MNIKKILYVLSGLIILAIIVNVIIHFNTKNKYHEDVDRNTDQAQTMADAEWNETNIDPAEVNVINMEMTAMIEEVTLEKNPVCSGEDVMVSVKAKNPRGSSNTLNYRVAGRQGNPVILNYKAEGEKQLHVFVRNEEHQLDHKVATLNVIECPDKPIARLKGTFSTSRLNEVDYEVVDKTGLEGDCTYEWDFGDGKGVTTTAGIVSHNYGDREQKSYTSTFMTKVTITDEKGTRIIARTNMTFANVQWLSSRMGTTVIPITYDRLPYRSGDDYKVNIQIKNIFDIPLTLTKAQVKFVPCTGNIEAKTETFPAGNFINKTSLAANEFAEDTLTIRKSIFPYPPCTVAITLSGKLSDGRDVTSPLYINIPMSPEAIQEAIKNNQATVISDDNVITKVQKARSILKKELVTPEDITMLEKKGKI